MGQHSSLIHPHPHHAHLHPRPEWKLQNVSGKDAKFSAQLEDKSAKDSPFILSYHHPYYCQKSPFWALLPLFVLSYHNLLPRAFTPTSKGNFGGKFILEMARSWNIWATATVIVCLNFKPLLLCLCGECSSELPPLPASKVSKDLQSVTRSGIKISQKTVRTRRRFTTLCVSLSFCRWSVVELSEKAAESFCRSWQRSGQCGHSVDMLGQRLFCASRPVALYSCPVAQLPSPAWACYSVPLLCLVNWNKRCDIPHLHNVILH